MLKIGYIFFVAVFLFSSRIFPQADTVYYNVIEKDTLYYTLSNRSLMILSSNGNGNFYLQDIKYGNFNGNTRLSVNEKYILLHHQDSVYLYNKDNPFGFIAKSKIPFTVKTIWPFGNDFVLMTNTLVKIVDLTGDSIKVKNDSVTSAQNLFVSYPYFIESRKIYKYLEGFGYYQVYILEEAISALTVYKNKMVYHTWRQSSPSAPPQECNLEGRVFQEPNFPNYFVYEMWGLNQYYTYALPIYSVSDRYIEFGLQETELIYNYSLVLFCISFSSDTSLTVTDRYIFKLSRKLEYSNSVTSPAVFQKINVITNIIKESFLESDFVLCQNYPNPFNPSTKISWHSPVSSWQTLKVYDVLGNEVATLVNGHQAAGNYEVEFSASSAIGNLASGIYFYQLKSGDFIETKKMILLR
jgi:hypothetical protein